jgi:hypothetical protein
VYVVKPLADLAELRVFISPTAAQEWAETGAYAEFGAQASELHWIEGMCSPAQATELVRSGKSEKRATVHRRITPREIDENKAAERRAWERKNRFYPPTPNPNSRMSMWLRSKKSKKVEE